MNPVFRRDTDHNYMILEAPREVQGDEYQVRMLSLNKIPGILGCKMRKMDGQAGFYYEITDLQPMARVFERRKAGLKDILALLTGMRRAMEGARSYLLDANQFLLDPEFIYMRSDPEEVLLCCLPFYDRDIGSSFRELAEYILKKLDHGDPEAVLLGYDIYSRAVEENCGIQQVLESVREKLAREKRESSGAEEEPEEPLLEEMEETPEAPEERPGAGERRGGRNEPPEEGRRGGRKEAPEEGRRGGRKEAPDGPAVGDRKETLRERRRSGQKEQRKGLEREDEKNAGEPAEPELLREQRRSRWKRAVTLAFGTAASGTAALVGTLLGGADRLQAGGIFFLGVGITVYGVRILKRLPKPPARRPKMGKEYEARALLWEEEEPAQPEGIPGRNPGQEESGPQAAAETEVLSTGYSGGEAALVSLEPGARGDISLDRPRITVGKLADTVDVVIDLSVVSRVHASLELRAEGWFLTDEGSRNGTYVNGTRLSSGQTRRLRTADEVYFASAGYRFQEKKSGKEK